MPAIVDTSALIALARSSEPQHLAVSRAIGAERSALVVPMTALVEAAQVIGSRHGPAAEASWVRALATGPWAVEQPTMPDLERAADLIDRYRDADIGFVDATIVAMAERLGSTRLYTLDRRDFGIIRPRHVTAFELLP